MQDFDIGHVVRSTAGRDRDQVYIVWRAEGDFIWLVDGKAKRPETPKRKRCKHVEHVDILKVNDLSHILNGIRDGSAASRVRKLLKSYSIETIEMKDH